MNNINTVTGLLLPEQLGKTMMHEHLVIGLPGWEVDTAHPGPTDRELLAICCDRVGELRDTGVNSFVDPCPSDLGRNAGLAAEVSVRTGMNIVAATGLFHEAVGKSVYWKTKLWASQIAGEALAPHMAELFIKELTVGIGNTGVKAGIIKVATGAGGGITEYERTVFQAAAMASLQTGAPITTHTEQGELGIEQQNLLLDLGVPAHRIIIGHSDGSPDFHYHRHIADNGSYLGFDRFGYQRGFHARPDEEKIESLIKIIRAGRKNQLVVSCDYVCAYLGDPWPLDPIRHANGESYSNLHFVKVVLPMLRQRGVTDDELTTLMIDNPCRYFSDIPPTA